MANQKVDEIYNLAISLTLETKKFSKQQTALNKGINGIEKAFKTAGKGVKDYENTFVGLNAKIEKSEKQLDLYEKKLELQRNELKKTQDNLVTQQKKLDEVAKSVGENSKEYEEWANKIHISKSYIQKLTVEIVDSEKNIELLNKSLNESRQKMATLGQEAATLEDQLEENNRQLELQQSELKVLSSQFDDSSSSVRKMLTEMKSIGAEIEKNIKDISLYESKLQTLSNEIKDNQSNHMKLGLQIQEMERQLDQAKMAYGENSTEATQLSHKLLSLKDDYNRLSKEIDEQQTEYTKLNTKMNEAKSEVNELSRELKSMPFDKVKDDLDTISDKFSVLSKSAAGIGGASVAAFGEASNALGKIKGALAETTEEAEKTLDGVQELAKDGFDFDEALQTMIIVKQTMSDLLDDKELDEFTSGVLAISKQMDKDFNDVIKTSNSLMRNFGIDSEEALDIIAYGIQNGLDISGDFLDSLWEYSTQFNDLGFTAKQSLDIITKGMKEGTFNTDKLADMLKESKLRLVEMGDGQTEAIKKLGLNATTVQKNIATGGEVAANQMVEIAKKIMELEDPITQSAIGVELFGTMFEDLGLNGVKALSELGDGTLDVQGRTEEVRQSFEETFGAQIKGKLQELKEPLIQLAEKGLVPVLDVAGDLIKDFSDWFSTLDEGTIEAMAKMGLFTIVLSPLAGVLGNVIGLGSSLFKVMGNFGGATATASGATGGLTSALGLLASPVGMGVALGALAALLAYIGDNENMLLSLQENFGGFGTTISAICEFISGVVQLTIGNAISWFQLGFDVIGAMIDGPGGATIEDAWTNHWGRIESNQVDGWQKLSLTTTRGMSQMLNTTDDSLNQMLSVFEVTMGELPGIVDGEYGFAANKLAGQLQGMDNTQLTILRGMNDTTGWLFRGIRENMTVSEQTAQIKQNLKSMADAGKLDTEIFSKDIQSAMETMSDQLDKNTSEGGEKATSNTEEMKDDVVEDAEEMSKDSRTAAKDMSEKTIQTTNQMKSEVTKATDIMADQAIYDWNRIRNAYSRSISGTVTVTTRNVQQRIVASSDSRTVSPMQYARQLLDTNPYQIQGYNLASQQRQGIQIVRNTDKTNQRTYTTEKNEYHLHFNFDNVNSENQKELKKIVEYVNKELQKIQNRTNQAKGKVKYAT